MPSVFDAAAAAPIKATAGPTQYRPLRDALSDSATAQRLQLAARMPDGEPFVLACKTDAVAAGTAPVDALNAANRTRADLRAQLAALPDEGKRNAAQVKAAEDLTGKIKALPRIDALRSAPVARALVLYSAQDDAAAAAAPSADAPAGE